MIKTTEQSTQLLASPWPFFAIVFAWTWVCWFAAAALGLDYSSTAGLGIMIIGVASPTIFATIFLFVTQSKESRREYWSRLINVKLIPWQWYLVLLFFAPALNTIAALIDVLLGGTGATWGEAALSVAADPLSVFSTVLPSLLFATLVPFLEEMGWRYALDRLQSTHTALVSSLILGVLLSIWHLPLFFVEGTYQYELGLLTWEFWLFMVGIVPLTFVITWIYNNTRYSILSVILFHAAINLTGELIHVTERADTIAIGLYFIAAIGIVAIFGADTFTGKKAESKRQLAAATD